MVQWYQVSSGLQVDFTILYVQCFHSTYTLLYKYQGGTFYTGCWQHRAAPTNKWGDGQVVDEASDGNVATIARVGGTGPYAAIPMQELTLRDLCYFGCACSNGYFGES